MRNPSCTMRCPPPPWVLAPSVSGPRILPKVGLLKLVSGTPQGMVFVKLKNSPVNFTLHCSLMLVSFEMDRFRILLLGDCSNPQQKFPIVPKAGVAKAAGLNQRSGVLAPPYGSPTKSTLPPNGELPFNESPPELMLNGVPLRSVKMPLMNQPPNTLETKPEFRYLLPFPAGSSYTQLIKPE
jgi:hypothetical protein